MKNLILSVCVMISFLMNAQVDSVKNITIDSIGLIEAQEANRINSDIIFQVPEVITNFKTTKGKLRNRSQANVYFKCYENNDIMQPLRSLTNIERWNTTTKQYEALPMTFYSVNTTQFRLSPRQNQSIVLNHIDAKGIYRYALHITIGDKQERTSMTLYSNTFEVKPMTR